MCREKVNGQKEIEVIPSTLEELLKSMNED
jgi:hypothetical protein